MTKSSGGLDSVPTRDRAATGLENESTVRAEAVDINPPLAIWEPCSTGLERGAKVESNERYYRRRACEERLAARRAMTDQARAWHAKLADDFAARAMDSTTATCATSALI